MKKCFMLLYHNILEEVLLSHIVAENSLYYVCCAHFQNSHYYIYWKNNVVNKKMYEVEVTIIAFMWLFENKN